MPPITVVLAAPHHSARAELRAALAHEPAIHVVGEACTRWDAGDLARVLRPDVVVADTTLLSTHGFFLAGWGPITRDVGIVAVGPADPVETRRLLSQGVLAYVERDRLGAELAAAVGARSVARA